MGIETIESFDQMSEGIGIVRHIEDHLSPLSKRQAGLNIKPASSTLKFAREIAGLSEQWRYFPHHKSRFRDD